MGQIWDKSGPVTFQAIEMNKFYWEKAMLLQGVKSWAFWPEGSTSGIVGESSSGIFGSNKEGDQYCISNPATISRAMPLSCLSLLLIEDKKILKRQ